MTYWPGAHQSSGAGGCVAGDQRGNAVDQLQRCEVQLINLGTALVTGGFAALLAAAVHQFGVAEGATLLVDGRGLKVAGHEDGYFLGPCLDRGRVRPWCFCGAGVWRRYLRSRKHIVPMPKDYWQARLPWQL